LIAPMKAPISMSSGIPTQALSRPECGSSQQTRMTLDSTAIGPIEMSSPPPPETIAGVEAIATIANGASVPSSTAQLTGLPNAGSAMMLAASRQIASNAAKSQGRRRTSTAK
jgi:hypothetical protein